MSDFFGHLATVNKHRRIVRRLCFKVGLYAQGLIHDLSKYSFLEFSTGVKYYRGTNSPNSIERGEKGYSASWLHHKGRNRHHSEYWMDTLKGEILTWGGLKMPLKYVVEMFCDRVAACKVYQGDAYTDKSPLEYFERTRAYSQSVTHPETLMLLEKMLKKLSEDGEETTLQYIRHTILKNGKDSDY